MHKVRCINTSMKPADALCFIGDSCVRFLACHDAEFSIFEIDDVVCSLEKNYTFPGRRR